MFERTKKVTGFLAKMPASVLGITQIKQNNTFLKQQWRSISGPVCPHCYQAIMLLDPEQKGVRRRSEDGQSYVDLYHWVCTSKTCDADELLPENTAEAREWACDIHNQLVSEKVGDMDEEDMSPYLKSHLVSSRIMYSLSFVCLLFMMGSMAFSDTSIFKIFILYMPVAIACFVAGFKRSYRHWQLSNKRLFDETAFKEWLSSGKWFV